MCNWFSAASVNELDQQEQTSLLKPHGNDSDGNEDGKYQKWHDDTENLSFLICHY